MKNLIVCLLVFTAGNLLQAQELDFEWPQKMGLSSGNEKGLEKAVDALGNTMVLGSFDGLLDLDTAGNFLTANIDRPFILKLDTSHAFVWVIDFSTSFVPFDTRVHVNHRYQLFTSGYFTGEIDCDPGQDTVALYSTARNTYLIKFSQGYVDPDEEEPTKTFRVWPNPTDGLMYIDLGKTMESVMATVTAVDGKLMFEQQFQSTAQLELSFENLPRGVYFVTIKGDGLRETVRVVKK